MASRPTRSRRSGAKFEYGCESRKPAYDTREAAWQQAERMMDLGLVNPGCHLTPYQCLGEFVSEACGRWHIANRRIFFPND